MEVFITYQVNRKLNGGFTLPARYLYKLMLHDLVMAVQ